MGSSCGSPFLTFCSAKFSLIQLNVSSLSLFIRVLPMKADGELDDSFDRGRLYGEQIESFQVVLVESILIA